MFSKIFSVLLLCMSINQIQNRLKDKTPFFDKINNINAPTEPQKIITPLKKPILEEWANTNQKYIVKITNPNNVEVGAYIDDSINAIYIQNNSYEIQTFNWEENQTTKDILVYFKDNNGQKTDSSLLTINRPQTKLQAPTYEIIKNNYDEYSIKIKNPNNTNVILYCQSEQNLYEQDIASNDYYTFTEQYEGNTYTITAYFYKLGGAYSNSNTITINMTRPSKPHYLSGGYGIYNYIPSTHTYEITIENTNQLAVNYSDNFSNNFTMQANTTKKINIKLSPTQENLTVNGTFTPTSGNYQTTNIQLEIKSINYIDINSISRQPNGNITIKYKNAQPIKTSKWSIGITDGTNYTDSINLNIQNTDGTITIENQPANKLYLTIFYNSTIVETKTIDEVHKENEIIDIPSIMLLILTLPFSFLSQAFDLTLFPGTQYAFNVADIILTIIGAIIIFYIIKLIIKMIKLF